MLKILNIILIVAQENTEYFYTSKQYDDIGIFNISF